MAGVGRCSTRLRSIHPHAIGYTITDRNRGRLDFLCACSSMEAHMDQVAKTSRERPDRVIPGESLIGSSVEALKRAFMDNLYYTVGRYPEH